MSKTKISALSNIKFSKKKWITFLVILAIGFISYRIISHREPEKELIPTIKEKTTSIITFGKWLPGSSQRILGTIESSGDIDIIAETTGTIEKVFVSLGDRVTKGQVLANFVRSDNSGQIAYENALRGLNVTQLSVDSAVQSAQIAYENALAEKEQTILTEGQNKKRTFDTLLINARNAETTIQNVIDWMDSILGATERFTLDSNAISVAINDSIGRQNARIALKKVFEKTQKFTPLYSGTEEDILNYATNRLWIAKETQNLVRNLDGLIRRTEPVGDLASSEKSAYLVSSETNAGRIDAIILSLESGIESAKSEDKRVELSLLSSANRVEASRSALELSKSNAKAQIISAESQVRNANLLQNNLQVISPLDGIISAKNINALDQVNLGTPIFTVVSESVAPHIIASITEQEASRIESSESIDVLLENGEKIAVEKSFLSFKKNPQTQKLQVQFEFPKADPKIKVGSIAEIIIPIKNGHENLLPLSSIAFEPDGAEVLIVNAEQKAERKKIEYARIVGDAVEVSSGIEFGTNIVEFRNRAHAGEIIKPLEK